MLQEIARVLTEIVVLTWVIAAGACVAGGMVAYMRGQLLVWPFRVSCE